LRFALSFLVVGLSMWGGGSGKVNYICGANLGVRFELYYIYIDIRGGKGEFLVVGLRFFKFSLS